MRTAHTYASKITYVLYVRLSVCLSVCPPVCLSVPAWATVGLQNATAGNSATVGPAGGGAQQHGAQQQMRTAPC